MAITTILRRSNLQARLLASTALPLAGLTLASPAAAQTSPVPDQPLVVNAGEVRVDSNVRVTSLEGSGGPITITGIATLNVDQFLNTEFSGSFSRPDDAFGRYLIKNGPGTLTLSGTNTQTQSGEILVQAGRLDLRGGNAVGDDNVLAVVGGTVRMFSDETIGLLSGGAGGALDLGGGRLTIDGSGLPFQVAADLSITGSGILRFAAPNSIMTLGGSNPFVGTYQVTSGTVRLTRGGVFDAQADILIDGGTLDLNTFDASVDNFILFPGTLQGPGTLGVAGNFTMAGGTIASGVTVSAAGRIALLGGTIAGTLVGTQPNPVDPSAPFPTTVSGSSVTVTGAVQLAHGLEIGSSVPTTLLLSGGGQASSQGGMMARAQGSTASVEVRGTNSQWSVAGQLNIGFNGAATMLIADGGAVQATDIFAALTESSSADIVVTGTNSRLVASQFMFLGSGGEASLTLSDGGFLQILPAFGSATLRAATLSTGRSTLNFGAAAGQTAVAPGTVVARDIEFGSGEIVFNHTSSDFALSLTISGNARVRHLAGTTQLNGRENSFRIVRALNLSGPDSLSVEGGILRLFGDNIFANPITVSGGTLFLGSSGAAGGASGRIVTTGSVISLGDGIVNAAEILVDSTDTQIEVQTGTATQAGAISELNGPRPIEKIGAGTLVLTGTNTYSGPTTISAGTLQIGNGGTGGSLASASIVNNAALVFDRADDFAIAAAISGNGTVSKQGAGTLTVTGDITSSGPITISSGTLQIGNGGTTGRLGNQNIVNNANLAFNRSDDLLVGNVISGTGSLTKLGAGTLRLSGANTYSGLTTVAEGTLALANNGALGTATSGTIVADGASLAFVSGVTNWTEAFTINGIGVNGGGALRTLSGGATLNGQVTLGSASRIIAAGESAMQLNGTVVGANHDLTIGGTGRVVITSQLSLGSGRLIKEGTSALGLFQTNAAIGELIVTGGVVDLGAFDTAANLALADDVAVTLNGGTLQVNMSETIGSLAGTGGIVRDINRGTTLAVGGNNASTLFGGQFQQSLALTKQGTGTLTLTGNSTNTGKTTISGGTLEIGNGGTSGALGSGDVANDGVLAFNRSDATTVSNLIDGAGSLTQRGAGTLTLTAANTYTGGTLVTAGRLDVTGSLASGVTVNGGTLGGAGTINGLVTINGGGSLSAGTSVGTLTVDALALNAGSTTIFDLGAPGTVGGAGNDLIRVTGNLALNGGTIGVIGGSGFRAGRYTLFTFNTMSGALGNLSVAPIDGGFVGSLAMGTGAVLLNVGIADDLIWWNGSTTEPQDTIVGGSGTWSLAATNFTDAGGLISAPWRGNGSLAIFAGQAGTVTIAPGEMLAPLGLVFRTDGYTIAGGDAGSGLRIDGATGIDTDAGVSATIAANISGPGSLTKTGEGSLTLSGGFAIGTLNLLEGTLQLGRDGLLRDTSELFVFGGTLDLDGTTGTTGSVTMSGGAIAGGGTLRLDGLGIAYTQSAGTIASGTAVDVADGGTINLSGGSIGGRLTGFEALLEGGAVEITGELGVERLVAVGDAGAGSLSILGGGLVGAGSLQIGSTPDGDGNVTVSGTGSRLAVTAELFVGQTGAGSLLIENGGEASIGTGYVASGAGSTGSVTVTGANSLWRNAAELFVGDAGKGTLTIAEGGEVRAATTIIANLAGSTGVLAIGSGEGAAAAGAGTLDSAAVSFGAGAGQLVFNHTSDDYAFNAAISGNGLIRHLAGSTRFNGNIMLGGAIDIAGGRVELGGTTVVGGRVDVAEGATVSFDGLSTSIGSLAGNGAAALRAGPVTIGTDSTSTTFGGVISGSGALIKTGLGTLTLTGQNIHGGLTTVSQGTLVLASTGRLEGAVDNAAQFGNAGTVAGLVTNSATLESTGVLSGGLVNAAGATALLSGTVRGTIANAGLIELAGDLGGAAILDQDEGAIFDAAGRNVTLGGLSGSGTVALAGADLIIFQDGLDTTFAGTISGATGILSKTGTGSLTLTGTNTFAGLASVTGGNLTIASGASLAGHVTNSADFVNAGSLGGALVNRAVARNAGSIAGGVQSDGMFVSTGLIGTAFLNSGTAQLQGAVNGLVGNGGTITVTGRLDGIDRFVQEQAGVLDLAGQSLVLGSLEGGGTVALGGGALTVGGTGANTAFAGVISGEGDLNKLGSGTFVLQGANTFTGATNVSEGILQLTETARLEGAVNVLAGARFENTGLVAGGLANAGEAISIGTLGTVENDGTLTSTGRIEGRLTNRGTASLAGLVTGDIDNLGGRITLLGDLLADGRLTQAEDATFDLDGAELMTGSIAGGGTIALGGGVLRTGGDDSTSTFAGVIAGMGAVQKLGAGTLTLTGLNTFTGTTFIEGGTLEIGVAGGAASDAGIAGGIVSRAVLVNRGTILGEVANAAGASATNLGAIEGMVVNMGTFASTGTLGGGLVNTGSVRLAGALGGDVGNAGAITLTGITTGIGTFHQDAAGSFDLGGFDTTLGVLAGSGSVDLGDAILTTGTDAVASLFAGEISGSGSLAKRGTGRLVLTGANTYSGGTHIADGVLQLGDGGVGGSIIGPVLNDGMVLIDRSDAYTFAGAIGGSGMFVQNGPGTTTLTGTNTYSGGTLVAAGRLVGNTAALQGAIRNDAVLEFAMGTDGTFAGTLLGSGRTEKSGAGVLTFGGDGSLLTGRFDVLGGGLRLDGRLDQALVSLASGTRLSGNGVVGGLEVASGAEVAPGASIGMIGVSGDVSFLTGSRYAAEVSEAGADLIMATGSAQLAGTLSITNIGTASYAFNSRYALIAADGGISGAFDAVDFTGFSPIYRPGIVGTADGLALLLAPGSLAGLAGPGITANQAAVAERFDAAVEAGFNPQAFFGVYSLPQGELAGALDQLSGEIHAGIGRASMRQSRLPREAVLGRAAIFRPGTAGTRSGNSFGTWGKLFRSWGEVDADGNAAAQDSDTEGFVLGLDGGGANDARAFRFGVYGSHLETRVTIAERGSSGQLRQTGGGAYAGLSLGGLSLVVGGGVADLDIDTSRTVALPGLADAPVGDGKGDVAQAFGRIGYRVELGDAAIEPFAAGDYARISLDPLVERGEAAALSAARQDYRVGGATVGLAGDARVGPVRFEAEAAARFELGDRTPEALVALAAAPGQATRISGTRLNSTGFAGRLAATARIAKGVDVGLSYSGDFSRNDTEHAAQAGISFAF